MLKKKDRADKKTMEKIFKEGRFINSPSLTFRFFRKSTGPKRISFIVPKTVVRLAVKRNLLRRLGYSALEGRIDRLPAGTLGIFVFRKYIKDVLIIKNEIENILNKIN